MQVEIKIDSTCSEPRCILVTAEMNQEIQDLLKRLTQEPPHVITGIRNERLEVLEPGDLVRIYASDGKVFAVTARGEYVLRQRLYEIEQRLDGNQFVRISNSEIINLKKVSHFDLSFTGTICVKLIGGDTTYVSRRYVGKIKSILGV